MKTIKVLLTENVDNLGIVGDVVSVRPGYARNYLLPHGYATEPTPGMIARLAEKRAEMEELLRKQRLEQQALIERLEGHELTIQRSANEQGVLFGGVSQHDVAEALREEGYPIEDRHVRLGEQIKRLDSYNIPIVLASDIRTEIKVWVVSDKPAEELQSEEEPQESGEAETQPPTEAEEAESTE